MTRRIVAGAAVFVLAICLSACAVDGLGFDDGPGYDGGIGVDMGDAFGYPGGYYEPFGGVYGGWGDGYMVGPPVWQGGEVGRPGWGGEHGGWGGEHGGWGGEHGGWRGEHGGGFGGGARPYRSAPAGHAMPSIPSRPRMRR